MFLASDPLEVRERRIRQYLARDPSVSVLLAAAHFEWTVCRAVLFLSKRPNSELHRKLEAVYGLPRYKEFWKEELTEAEGLGALPKVVRNWSDVHQSFIWRNRIVHGRDRCTRNMATPKVEAIVSGAADIWQFCSGLGVDLSSRLPVRRRKSVRERAKQTVTKRRAS